jgi:hypothetical protein
LFAAAVLSVAAVFAVHRIEAGGGPLSEPYATQFFAPRPGGDPDRRQATIRFVTKQTEQLDVVVRRCDTGAIVRHLWRDRRRPKGDQFVKWDGTRDHGGTVPDGCYRIDIRRLGDDRVYEPAKETYVDTKDPIAVVDRSAIKDGVWNGLIFTEAGVRLEYRTPSGEPLDRDDIQARIFPARKHHSSGTAKFITPPAGSLAYRFSVRVDEHPRLLVTAVDNAGNATDLPADVIDRAEVVQ